MDRGKVKETESNREELKEKEIRVTRRKLGEFGLVRVVSRAETSHETMKYLVPSGESINPLASIRGGFYGCQDRIISGSRLHSSPCGRRVYEDIQKEKRLSRKLVFPGGSNE